MATGGAISVLNHLGMEVFAPDLPGLRQPDAALVDLRVHRRYNPEGVTAYNVVPGLSGVILTMTMVMLTAMAIGLAISLFQAVTSIHEQTLSFVPKVIGIVLLLILLLPWMLRSTLEFTTFIISKIPEMVN